MTLDNHLRLIRLEEASSHVGPKDWLVIVKSCLSILQLICCIICPYGRPLFNKSTFIYAGSIDKTRLELDNLRVIFTSSLIFVDSKKDVCSNDVDYIKKLAYFLTFRDVMWSQLLVQLWNLYRYTEYFSVKNALRLIRNHIYYAMVYKHTSNIDIVINFFSSTVVGSIINQVSLDKNIRCYSYIWGSNIMGREQLETVHDVILAKSDFDLMSYQTARCRRKEVVGNLGLRNIVGEDHLEFDILLIDTCESKYFNSCEKLSLYKLIISEIKRSKDVDVRICVKFHPASTDIPEVVNLFSEFKNVVYTKSERSVTELLSVTSIAISINSTAIYQMMYSSVYGISFMPYFLRNHSDVCNEYYISAFCDDSIVSINNLDDFDLSDCVRDIHVAPSLFPVIGLESASLIRDIVKEDCLNF